MDLYVGYTYINSHYRLRGLVVGIRKVAFCVGIHVRKHTASPYKLNVTTAHVELSYFWCLLYVVFLLGPHNKKGSMWWPVTSTYTVSMVYVLVHKITNTVASPTSQFILQPFRRFTYVTTHSPTLPLLHLRHSSFSNPSFASPISQALHLRHLASRPCQYLVVQHPPQS